MNDRCTLKKSQEGKMVSTDESGVVLIRVSVKVNIFVLFLLASRINI
jgi:hypothetical protein